MPPSVGLQCVVCLGPSCRCAAVAPAAGSRGMGLGPFPWGLLPLPPCLQLWVGLTVMLQYVLLSVPAAGSLGRPRRLAWPYGTSCRSKRAVWRRRTARFTLQKRLFRNALAVRLLPGGSQTAAFSIIVLMAMRWPPVAMWAGSVGQPGRLSLPVASVAGRRCQSAFVPLGLFGSLMLSAVCIHVRRRSAQ